MAHPVEELGHQSLGSPVWQAEEGDVASVSGGQIGRGVGQVGICGSEARIQIGNCRARLGVAGGHHDLKGRMRCAEPKQLSTGETRRADDGDAM